MPASAKLRDRSHSPTPGHRCPLEAQAAARGLELATSHAAGPAYGHQYLTLSIVSIVGLSDQSALADRAQAASGRNHEHEMSELNRLIR
jgi:hypothetical protein